MLHSWDPIGVYEGEQSPLPDEYDDLVSPILAALRTPAGRESLPSDLRNVLATDYGLENADGVDEFATNVLAWWNSSHRPST